MTKHTPGPWTAWDLSDSVEGANPGDWAKWSVGSMGPICYGGDGGAGAERSEANACLIAASPTLLEDAEKLVNECEAEFTLDGRWVANGQLVRKQTFVRLRDTILKARGQIKTLDKALRPGIY